VLLFLLEVEGRPSASPLLYVLALNHPCFCPLIGGRSALLFSVCV
jgi:hypothetical protein